MSEHLPLWVGIFEEPLIFKDFSNATCVASTDYWLREFIHYVCDALTSEVYYERLFNVSNFSFRINSASFFHYAAVKLYFVNFFRSFFSGRIVLIFNS